MKSVAFSAIFVVMIHAAMAFGADNYREAYEQTQDTGKPLVILVGADWCPGCQAMRNSVMPAVEQHGELSKVAFAHVNTDRERELANQLLAGNMIPQLVMYTKTADGWKMQRMIGAQSPEAVEEFLNQAIPTTTVASVEKDKNLDSAN